MNCKCYNITQNVKVQKYQVDLEQLKQYLKSYKNKSNLTNKQISEVLNVPQTKVEHWFRNDSSFAIPDDTIWLKLKDILNITDTKYDNFIMEFEIKPNIYETSNRVYDSEYICPTLTTNCNNIYIKLTK